VNQAAEDLMFSLPSGGWEVVRDPDPLLLLSLMSHDFIRVEICGGGVFQVRLTGTGRLWRQKALDSKRITD
jgi:hypothetical protein